MNPIPASIPTTNNSLHLTPFGFSTTFNFDNTEVNNIIPTGFPTTNPIIIPNDSGIVSIVTELKFRTIAVF